MNITIYGGAKPIGHCKIGQLVHYFGEVYELVAYAGDGTCSMVDIVSDEVTVVAEDTLVSLVLTHEPVMQASEFRLVSASVGRSSSEKLNIAIVDEMPLPWTDKLSMSLRWLVVLVVIALIGFGAFWMGTVLVEAQHASKRASSNSMADPSVVRSAGTWMHDRVPALSRSGL